MAGLPASVKLGRYIARRREDLGILQAEFAARCNWSDKTQNRIERGQRALKNDGEVLLIARELNLSYQDLRAVATIADVDPVTASPSAPTLEELPAVVERLYQEVRDMRADLARLLAADERLRAVEAAEVELRSGLPAEDDEPSAQAPGRRATKSRGEPPS